MDFDYDEFDKYEDEYEEDEDEEEEEEEDDYVDVDVEERPRRQKKQPKKKSTKKSIFEIYEPSELKRGHFTDLDNEVRPFLQIRFNKFTFAHSNLIKILF